MIVSGFITVSSGSFIANIYTVRTGFIHRKFCVADDFSDGSDASGGAQFSSPSFDMCLAGYGRLSRGAWDDGWIPQSEWRFSIKPKKSFNWVEFLNMI